MLAKASNKYLEDYNASKHSNSIIYMDMNNLYGSAMIQPLLQRDHEFMNEELLQNFDFMSVPVNSPSGYILEVDLEYVERLHLTHNDYHLRPETSPSSKLTYPHIPNC